LRALEARRGAGAVAGDASDRVPQRPVREHAPGGGLSDSPLPETLMERSRMKRMFVRRTMSLMGALSLAMYSCLVPRAHAFDSSKWGHDAATSEWFRSLKNSRGESCCDYDDGVRLEDPEWRELEDHSFEVFSRGKWNKIPPNRVLKGTNRVGYAILWWPKAWDNPTCFLPGPEN
jgi:hypothetical protein